MQRGVIKLNNLELKKLCSLINSSEYFLENLDKKEKLLTKFNPVEENENQDQAYDVFINENEAETILDFMSVPDKDDNPSLVNVRVKIQQFLDKKLA